MRKFQGWLASPAAPQVCGTGPTCPGHPQPPARLTCSGPDPRYRIRAGQHTLAPVSAEGTELPLRAPEGKVMQARRFFQGVTCLNNETGEGKNLAHSAQPHPPGTSLNLSSRCGPCHGGGGLSPSACKRAGESLPLRGDVLTSQSGRLSKATFSNQLYR